MLCNSCKSKTSTDRCPSPALKSLQFCGRHAKVKTPRLWVEVNSVDPKVILIQKIWRGYRIRSYLALCGEGVLSRSECHNEDELITGEEKDKLHPMNYFSFKEAGKLYWFDVRSVFQWSLQHLQPQNPYTKQPICMDSRKRLKECIFRRERMGLETFFPTPDEPNFAKLFADRWMMVCQMMEENLHEEMNPILFVGLNRHQLWTFTTILKHSLLTHAKEHKAIGSRRNLYYMWIQQSWKRQSLDVTTASNVAMYLGGILLRILKDAKNCSDVCFLILSARYRIYDLNRS
jgi:hypothetical protein